MTENGCFHRNVVHVYQYSGSEIDLFEGRDVVPECDLIVTARDVVLIGIGSQFLFGKDLILLQRGDYSEFRHKDDKDRYQPI